MDRSFTSVLARSAVAAGVAGLFIETHPSPPDAMCDANFQWPLDDIESLFEILLELDYTSKTSRLNGTLPIATVEKSIPLRVQRYFEYQNFYISSLHEAVKDAFLSESVDLIRHTQANTKILKQILGERRASPQPLVVRRNHLEHLVPLPSSSEFSVDLYRALPGELAGEINHLRLRIRNMEQDIEQLLYVYDYELCPELYEFIENLIGRFNAAIEKTMAGMRAVDADVAIVDGNASSFKHETRLAYRKCQKECCSIEK